MKKRYGINIGFFIYEFEDEKAQERATKIIRELREQGLKASISKIEEVPFGDYPPKKIKQATGQSGS